MSKIGREVAGFLVLALVKTLDMFCVVIRSDMVVGDAVVVLSVEILVCSSSKSNKIY